MASYRGTEKSSRMQERIIGRIDDSRINNEKQEARIPLPTKAWSPERWTHRRPV
jgi:hypothetical protein